MTQAGSMPSHVGRYQILEELGRGAMGVVYAAMDPVIGRRVAVKTVCIGAIAEESEREPMRQRLRREASAAGILSHPAIVTIYDVGEQDDLAYIVMEFVDGTNLEKILTSGAAQHTDVLFNILRRTAEGLDYAHGRGLVHRDVKPSNIITTTAGVVKIADFGIAKFSASTAMTHSGLVLGTPNYVSPEQAKGGTITGSSDQFSLAVVACRMLTGKLPFSGPTLTVVLTKLLWEEPEHLNDGLNPEVQRVLRKALDKDPGKRFQNCVEFVDELTRSRWLPIALQPREEFPSADARELPARQGQTAQPPESLPALPAATTQSGRPAAPGAGPGGDRGVARDLAAASVLERSGSHRADLESSPAPPTTGEGTVPETPPAAGRVRATSSLILVLSMVAIAILVVSFATYRSLAHRVAAGPTDGAAETTPAAVPSLMPAPGAAGPEPGADRASLEPKPPVRASRTDAVSSAAKPIRRDPPAGTAPRPVKAAPSVKPEAGSTPEERTTDPVRERVSGVIFWSGKMVKNSVLIIDGPRASHGQMVGRLPGVPVRIELEPHTVEIREHPGKENNWNRVILYSGQEKRSSIHIRWSTLE